MERLLTPIQAAHQLGISHRTLERWRADDFGPPSIALGRRAVRYTPDDLREAFEESKTETSAAS